MTRARREPARTIRLLADDGTILGTVSVPGPPSPDGKAALREVPRAKRRAVITCETGGHVLAVVHRDGLVFAAGEAARRWMHLPEGWRPIVSDDSGAYSVAPFGLPRLRLTCPECGLVDHEANAADVPDETERKVPVVGVLARRVLPST